jgi:hypothetical protein
MLLFTAFVNASTPRLIPSLASTSNFISFCHNVYKTAFQKKNGYDLN